jgi:hypothetical protein
MTSQIITPVLSVVETPSAGGGPLQQIIFATIAAMIMFGAVAYLAISYRRGRNQWLGQLGEFASKQTGLPSWAALPLALLTGSLLLAVFGLYWDIAVHIANGRDEGPLGSAAHYPIMFGLYGCLSAGIFALTMPKPGTRPSPWAVRIAEGWYAPVGGILIVTSTAFGLVGFPLDDFWHRLFGQDVTLWGPTHLLMLTGAGLCLVGAAVLLTEGRWAANRVNNGERNASNTPLIVKARAAAAGGGLLIALSIYQGEFDFGVAQFQMLLDPVMQMVAAGVALTFARITAGKGGAILAALFFIAVRGGLTLIVNVGLDLPVAHFPLYLAAAVAVELVGFAMADKIASRPIQFGLASGVAVGTLGLAGAWAWTQVWMPYPWTEALLPEGVIFGLVAAICGGAIGAWVGNALMLRQRPTGPTRFAPLVGFFVIIAMVAYGLQQYTPTGLTATLTNIPAATDKPGKWVNTTIKLNTTRFDTDKKWAVSIAWQDGGFHVKELEQTGPGTFQTTQTMPASGNWKSMVRFHSGTTMMGVPIYAPNDPAIPAAEVPALPTVTRPLQADRVVLQREYKFDSGWLQWLGYIAVFAIAMFLLGMLGWGIQRVSRPLTDEQKSGGGFDEPTLFRRRESGGPRPTATPSTT